VQPGPECSSWYKRKPPLKRPKAGRLNGAPELTGSSDWRRLPGPPAGFLVAATEDAKGKIFLVTNKHVIGDWNYADRDFRAFRPWINVFFYRANDPSGQTYRPSRIDLVNGANLDASRVHLHATPRIDIVAIDVTDEVRDPREHIDFVAYGPSYLLKFGSIQDQLTDIADEVIALGYPLGIRSLNNDYPIAKIGTFASVPGQEVRIPIRPQDRSGSAVNMTLDGKFLVVDGLIVPGNSGGPVVLAGGTRVRHDPTTKQIQFSDESIKNYVVGVASYGLGGGLTIVVSSDYVLDLLQSLSPPK
jgi:hypothetical protein